MRKVLAYLFILWAITAQGQLDSLTWDAMVWGQHRSNSLPNELVHVLVRGGNIAPSVIESARTAQNGEMGAMGYASGLALNWQSLRPIENARLRLCGSFQFKTLGEARWTPELYDLIFTGNAGHLGQWDVLDGSRVRTATWIQAAVGLSGANQNRIELALVYRMQSIDAMLDNGLLYVSEGLDYMTGYVRGYAAWSEVGSWGLATNAEWHFLRQEAPIAFHLRLQNFGFAVAPRWTEQKVDTALETTGFTLAELSLESLAQLSGGTTGIITTLNQRHRVDLLPFRIDASLDFPLGPRSGWDVQAQIGDWMPVPRVVTGYRRAFGKQWQAGIQLVAGGWGRLRPATWVRWRKPGTHAFVLFLEDPFGWGSQAAFGRGITLRYQNL